MVISMARSLQGVAVRLPAGARSSSKASTPSIVQMKQDEAEARALLQGVRPLSELDQAITF
jgi:hypothetical protein